MPSRKLEEYRKKRDFTKTAEPAGKAHATRAAGELAFVIQKHAATALHFDLRLELDGVMKSWAVPKGPSLDPAVKRLAMEVEDHPIEYNSFEGTIPKGEYGGGSVMLWDRGTYSANEIAAGESEPQAIEAGLATGKLAFTFHGQRLHGSFALVRTRGTGSKPQWLLIKHRDQHADPGSDIVAEYTTSVATGRTMDEIATGAVPLREADDHPRDATWTRSAETKAGTISRVKQPAPTKHTPPPKATKSVSTKRGARRGEAAGIEPMLASVGTELPAGKGWTFEPKYDGIRVIAYATPSQVALITRNGIDKTRQFPEIAEALKTLATRRKADLVLDAEVVALANGNPARFQALQNRIHLTKPNAVELREEDEPAALIAFDLLADGHAPLLSEPWTTRRQALERRLGDVTTGALRLGETSPDGEAMLARAREAGWEGVMAKRTDSRYDPGHRTRAWMKLKIEERQEFVVGGWTDPRLSRVLLGALLIGYYKGSDLLYAGHVGGGFTDGDLRAMHKRLMPLARKTSPFSTIPKSNEPAHWVEPKVVVEVKFSEWTGDGRLRHPVFVGVRDDKSAKTVTREPESIQHAPDDDAGDNALVAALLEIERGGGDGTIRIGKSSLNVSNLGKKFFPKDGYTKGDLLRFYARIADAIVPTMTDRPLVLKRFPNGIEGKPFYQQNAPDTVPEGVRVETIKEADGDRVHRFVGGSLVTLLYTVQLASISVDPWMARLQSMDTPDYTVIDLDPGPDAPFRRVVDVARFVKEELDALGLHGVPKTSGASGIHIYLPLPPKTSEESARLIAQLIATRVAQKHPQEATIERKVQSRPSGTVYVDYLQNIVGKTVAGVYAVRAVDGAHVSTPLEWSELTDDLEPSAFTIRTFPRRLAARGDLWAQGMKMRNTARALRALTT